MSNWKKLIFTEMDLSGETRDSVVSSTLSDEELAKEFDDGYGRPEGIPFTIWTKKRVYFPVVYDGTEWCASVSRNPDGKPTEHIGG